MEIRDLVCTWKDVFIQKLFKEVCRFDAPDPNDTWKFFFCFGFCQLFLFIFHCKACLQSACVHLILRRSFDKCCFFCKKQNKKLCFVSFLTVFLSIKKSFVETRRLLFFCHHVHNKRFRQPNQTLSREADKLP